MPAPTQKRMTRSSVSDVRANSVPILPLQVLPERVHDVFDIGPPSPHDELGEITAPSPIPLDFNTSGDIEESLSIQATPGHGPYTSSTSSKKARRKLTSTQAQALESQALLDDRPSLEVRRQLAEELQLELRVVSVWFQNKRRPCNTAKLRGIGAITATADNDAGTEAPIEERQERRGRQPLKDKGTCLINGVDAAASTTSRELWKRLPSSSPVRRSTAPPFSRKAPAPRKGSLEWACSKISQAKARVTSSYRKTKSKELKESSAKAKTQQQSDNINPVSVKNVKDEYVVPQPVWDAYGRDAVEVALALVQLRYGEV